MKLPPKLMAIALMIFLLALAGCAAPQPGTALDPVEPGETAGGQVILIIPEEPATLNRYLADAAIVRQVSDATLIGLSKVDQDGVFQPELAQEIPTIANGGVSEDFLTVTWRLRPGLQWSDGEPITSEDVMCTWQAITHPESGTLLATGAELIESIDTPDDLTAVVTYSEVNNAYPMQFAAGLFPCHAIGEPEAMTSWDWNRRPVAAGPFVVTEWAAGDNIIMDRNPYYYEEDKPYLDRLIFRVIPDPGAQMAVMIQGDGDVHLWPGSDSAEIYDAQVREVASLQEIPGPWNMAIRFNLSQPFDGDPGPEPPHPFLGDLRVRHAISHATDFETIVNDVNPGTTPATSPFAYGWFQCDVPRQYDYDPARAQELLEEAGFVDQNGDGIRECRGCQYAEEGQRLSVQLNGYTNFQALTRLQEAMVEMWREVGIEASIQNDDFSIIFGSWADGSPRKTGNFDMLIYDALLPIEPHASVANQFHSSAIPSAENPGGANYSRWVNEQVDDAIERAGSTVDIDERRAAYCEIAELIAEELPQLHIFLFTEGYGASSRLSGYTVSMWGSMTWDVENWMVE
jgi:peptide/nickel transport system substrate-binding protein